MNTKLNEAAFPIFDSTGENTTNEYGCTHRGISVRDYYATHILSGLCGRESLETSGFANKVKLADFCFEMADVMLERREVKIERKI